MRGKVILALLILLGLAVPASADVQCVGFGCPMPGSITNSSIIMGLRTGFPDGTVANPAIFFTSADDGSGTGFYLSTTNTIAAAANGGIVFSLSPTAVNMRGGSAAVTSTSPNQVKAWNGGGFCWSSTTNAETGTCDTGFFRHAAGVIKATDGAATNIKAFIGGGAAVASATALPAPTGRIFHVTGTTNITSITSTNHQSGVCIMLIFDDVLTFTDGSNLVLAGDFVTTANDTISLCYDGTSWFETGRSVN